MDKIAVHCPTEDELEKVTKKARGDGWEFTLAPPYYTWNRHKENTCLDFDNKEDKRLDAASLRYYKANNYTIISASDYLAYGLEDDSLLGIKVGDTVRIIDSTCPRCGLEAKIQGIFPKEFHPYQVSIDGNIVGSYFRQELKLVEEPEFEVGDEVEVISGVHFKYFKSHIGVITSFGTMSNCYLDGDGASILLSKLKLIKRKEDMKQHTIPLRVDDKVRVVSTKYSYGKAEMCNIPFDIGKEGIITKVASNGNCFFKGECDEDILSPKDLELIPTETDITVGSVWEGCNALESAVSIKKVAGFDKDGDPITDSNTKPCQLKHRFLETHKLIHRGDGEMDGVTNVKTQHVYGVDRLSEEYNKTNKKEKKMKTKVITEGLPIIDKACDNLGVVVYFDYESGEVAYKEPNGKHCFGHIDNIQLAPVQVVIPEPKPVKKKTKKTTKRGK